MLSLKLRSEVQNERISVCWFELDSLASEILPGKSKGVAIPGGQQGIFVSLLSQKSRDSRPVRRIIPIASATHPMIDMTGGRCAPWGVRFARAAFCKGTVPDSDLSEVNVLTVVGGRTKQRRGYPQLYALATRSRSIPGSPIRLRGICWLIFLSCLFVHFDKCKEHEMSDEPEKTQTIRSKQ